MPLQDLGRGRAATAVTTATDQAAVLEAFERALRREAHVLDKRPGLVWQQLDNRLQWRGPDGSAALDSVVGSELERRRASGTAWVREITLRRESDAMDRVLAGHTRGVRSVASSPDGAVIASGGDDGTLVLWDAATGLRMRSVAAHQGAPGFKGSPRLAGLAFSPGGDRIVTCGWDKAIRLWDSSTLGLVWEEMQEDADGALVSCAFSPDGETIVVTGSDIRILDAVDGVFLIGFVGHLASESGRPSAITTCAFSPDGTRFVSGGYDGRLIVWDAEDWDQISSLAIPDNRVESCAFSPDGGRIVAADGGGVVRIWDLTAATEPMVLVGHRGPVAACAFSPDGAKVLSAGRQDQSLILWDARTGEALATLQGHDGGILACAFALDGGAVVSSGDDFDPNVRLWQVRPVPRTAPADGHQKGVLSCAFSDDGSLAVTGGEDGSAHLWDGITGEHRSVLDHQSVEGVFECAFALGGRKVVTRAGDVASSFLWLWDVEDHDLPDDVVHDGVQGFSVSPDGERIVSYGGGTLRMWEAATGEEVQAVAVGTVHCVAFTHDGERLVIGYDSGRVGLVDPATLLESEGAEIAETPVWACDVSPDDRRIACGTTNGMLWLWDRGSQRKLPFDSEDGRDVRACRFSPDGRWVAAGYGVGDGVRIWDATSGELVRYGPSESGRPRTMAFRPSSLALMTARSDASLAVWPVDAHEPAAVWYGGRFVDALAVSPDGSRVVCGHTGGAVMLLALEGLDFATPGASPA